MASKIIHKHSSVITENKPKLPTSDQLEYGELAVNYAKGGETITLKNKEDEIVEFKSKEYYENILNENNYAITSAITYLDNKIQDALNEVTYDELKSMVDNSTLVPGSKYRIIDYVSIIKDYTIEMNDYASNDNPKFTVNVKSANHPFDIVVTALSTNGLSEDAKACLHLGDTYFSESELGSWELKYSINNNTGTGRFSWGDEENGKGVIWYMKDEFNNEAWYDFKNALFSRGSDFINHYSSFSTTIGLTEEKYFYTFSKLIDGNIIDESVYSTTNGNTTTSYNNSIGKYNSRINRLNNTIFINTNINANTINNTVGYGSYCNTFGPYFNTNTIGKMCRMNTIGGNFAFNTIDVWFSGNTINDIFKRNTVGKYFINNRLNGMFGNNTFGDGIDWLHFSAKNNEEITFCNFGSENCAISYIPALTKITFDSKCFISKDSTTIFGTFVTENGEKLSDVLSKPHEEQLYVYKTDKENVCGVHKYSDNVDDVFHEIVNTPNNQGDIVGYYGKLNNYGLSGDCIDLKTITIYKNINRELDETEYYCKVLLQSSNVWNVIFRSENTVQFFNGETNDEATFEMIPVENPFVISNNDNILIIFSKKTDDNSNLYNAKFDKVRMRTMSIKGAITTGDNVNDGTYGETSTTIQQGYSPAFSFKYSYKNKKTPFVSYNKDEEINGIKTFNEKIIAKGNIVITDSDNDKTVIRTDIDSGELKVTKPDSNQGFIIRTSASRTNDGKQQLEMLTTNGTSFYSYNFPFTNGTVALNNVVTQEKDGLMSSNDKQKLDSLSAVLKYCGETTTELNDGATASTVTINGSEHAAEIGCVVFYNGKEFAFNGSIWNELGYPTDLSNYYPKNEIDDKLETIGKTIENNEFTVATAIVDLESRKQDIFELGEGLKFENGKLSLDIPKLKILLDLN